MNEMIEFLTSKEIVVVYIVVAVACLLCFIIYLLDKGYYKRKQRQNTRELKRIVESVNEVMEESNPSQKVETTYTTPVLEKVEELENVSEKVETKADLKEKVVPEVIDTLEEVQTSKEENIVLESMKQEDALTYTEVEPNPEEAQEALRKLTEELERAEQDNQTNNIDLTTYEAAQEENAIISLEELLKKSKEMYESNEITQYADEGNEPISIQDLEERMNKTKQTEVPEIIEVIEEEREPEQLALDDFNTIKAVSADKTEPKEAYQSATRFHSSPVISPIYGIEKKDHTTGLELENTANYDKLDEEIKKTNEFLMTLKELQKHLD